MQLAHDLQMKLLPNDAIVAPEATVAARVVPAESVGGDFYNLFRLAGEDRRDDRRRVRARLSGRADHGADDERRGDSLADARRSGRDAARLMSTLSEELAMTEMFISAFYAVVDP